MERRQAAQHQGAPPPPLSAVLFLVRPLLEPAAAACWGRKGWRLAGGGWRAHGSWRVDVLDDAAARSRLGRRFRPGRGRGARALLLARPAIPNRPPLLNRARCICPLPPLFPQDKKSPSQAVAEAVLTGHVTPRGESLFALATSK